MTQGMKGSDHKQGAPAAPRSKKRQEGPSPLASGGSTACGHLDVGLQASRTERQHTSAVLSLQSVVVQYGHPRPLTL